jgi:hypothetical protein
MDLAYLHLILNHVPVLAAIFGFLILIAGIFFRSFQIRNVGLGFLVLAALTAIPVYLTGEPAEDVVEGLQAADGFIDRHESTAEISLILSIVSGAFALGALFPIRERISSNELVPVRHTFARLRGFLVLAALTASAFTSISMAWTAKLGGEIRHTEVRTGAAGVNQNGTEQKSATKRQKHDDDD